MIIIQILMQIFLIILYYEAKFSIQSFPQCIKEKQKKTNPPKKTCTRAHTHTHTQITLIDILQQSIQKVPVISSSKKCSDALNTISWFLNHRISLF